jgi:ubiquitin C-terminal hydrolase
MVQDLIKTSALSLPTLSVGQNSKIDPLDPLIGCFSTFPVSKGLGQSRQCTARTHQNMLKRCESKPNAGLKNSGKICYSNAIFQALASCNHRTTLFNDPRQQNHERFELYYAFAEVLHSMVKRQFSEQDVVDPGNLIDLFLERHTDFVDIEGEFC